MKKTVTILLIAVFVLGIVSAQIAETNYYIYKNKVFAEHYFDNSLIPELKIPYDAKNIEVNLKYNLENFDNYKIIKFTEEGNASVKYLTESMVDKSKTGYYFTSFNYLGVPQEVKLILPEYTVIAENGIVSPKADFLSTDGRSIILHWENYTSDQLIVHYTPQKTNGFWIYLAIVIICLFLIFLFFRHKKPKKTEKATKKAENHRKNKDKEKEILTMNLLEDEKRIVEFLHGRKNQEAWTKEIIKELEISKVKLSRKIRSLVKKELVKKIPYGNENRIKLLKK